MNIIDPKPNFNFSYGVLMQLGDKAVALIDQDQGVLTPYGVDAAFKTFLTSQTLSLKNYPSDEEMRGQESNETSVKDANAAIVRTGIRTMMVKVKSVFPEGSPNYNRFGTKGMSEMNDPDLSKCGYRVVRMLNEFHAQLPAIDQPSIDAFELDVKTFDDSYDEQQYIMRKHIATTHQRLIIANELYAKIVILFDFGKDYWSTRNMARYKDYVIYNTPSGTPELSGTTGSAHGIVKDKFSLTIIPNGMISLEFIDSPVQAGADGKWQKSDIPIECKTIFAMAAGHKLYKGTIQITDGGDTNFDILMEAGA